MLERTALLLPSVVIRCAQRVGQIIPVQQRVRADLQEVGIVEQFPKLEGRQMVMVLGPKKKGVPPKAKPKAKKDAAAVKPAA